MMRKGVQGPLGQSGNTPPPALIYDPPADTGLPVLFQDAHILVLSKPAGLLSVPGNKPELQDCLESRALVQYTSATTVHRLDRGTSGVCVMALTPEAHRKLGLQFEKRKTSKVYKALVAGCVSEDEGLIELPLRTDWYNRPKQMVDTCLGREAVTRWQVEHRFDTATLMRLMPETGRSHQLRVHMQFLGHPIIGDEFYAPDDVVRRSDRLMLHAEELTIRHPCTNEFMTFADPCPF